MYQNFQDWNIFVSDESFEAGLAWLERQVALKQAQLRGFFTYGDLAASCADVGLSRLLHGATRACLAACLAYTSGLAALLASALVVSHAWLPALQLLAARAAAPLNDDLRTSDCRPDLYTNNATLEHPVELLAEHLTEASLVTCCSKWTQYRETESLKRNWHDPVTLQGWKFELFCSTISVFNWPYQSSLVNPVQRWLEKMNEYADFIKHRFLYPESEPDGRRGVRQCLNFSRLSSWAASSSDR